MGHAQQQHEQKQQGAPEGQSDDALARLDADLTRDSGLYRAAKGRGMIGLCTAMMLKELEWRDKERKATLDVNTPEGRARWAVDVAADAAATWRARGGTLRGLGGLGADAAHALQEVANRQAARDRQNPQGKE